MGTENQNNQLHVDKTRNMHSKKQYLKSDLA